MRELKSAPGLIKSIKGKAVTGIFSVYGNLDDYDDRCWPGMLTKTLSERAGRFVHLWQHDFSSPPIAVITEIREVPRDQLPDEVLQRAPEAIGGAEVTREYLDTERGQEILTALKAGSPLEMSYAYDAIKYDYEEKPGAKYEWERVRNLREVRLYETSDVLWGANGATVATSKAGALPLDFLVKQLASTLETVREQLKAGARNASQDLERINTIGTLIVELGATSVKLATDSNDPALNNDGSKESRAADPAPAAPALTPGAYKYRVLMATRQLELLQRSVQK